MHHRRDLFSETSCMFWTSNPLCLPHGAILRVSRSVCLSPGYDACWCHQIPPKKQRREKKKSEHSCCRNVKNADCPPAPWGYQGSCKNRPKSEVQNRKTSIYLTAACLFQKTRSEGAEVRCDIHDRRHLETIGGSVWMLPSVDGCRQMKVTVLHKGQLSICWAIGSSCYFVFLKPWGFFGKHKESKKPLGNGGGRKKQGVELKLPSKEGNRKCRIKYIWCVWFE